MKNIIKILFMMLPFSGCMTGRHENRDLDFIYKTIVENHPGMYNNQDPGFKEHLEKSYHEAKKALKHTSQINEQKEIIRNFAKNFRDNHLRVRWCNSKMRNYAADKLESIDLNESVTWINLPTFGLNDRQKNQLNHILERLPKLRDKKAIIFDLRKNDGGNSNYGSKIVDSLFGKTYASQQKLKGYKAVYVDWRASEDNLSHVISSEKRYQLSSLKKVAQGLKQSLERKQPYYRGYFGTKNAIKNATKLSHLVRAKIIVIISSSNVSAALDFLDELKMMELDILLVGQETKSDRLYMDIRTVKLPSGLGAFFFPIKVYRNRPRADKETYKPDIICNISDTQNLQKFILNITDKIKNGN